MKRMVTLTNCNSRRNSRAVFAVLLASSKFFSQSACAFSFSANNRSFSANSLLILINSVCFNSISSSLVCSQIKQKISDKKDIQTTNCVIHTFNFPSHSLASSFSFFISSSLVLFSRLAMRRSILVSDSSFSFFHKSA